MTDSIQKKQQAIAYQLRKTADDIGAGNGMVADYEYDEITTEEMTERTVTIELKVLL